jgi:hypothetical protein
MQVMPGQKGVIGGRLDVNNGVANGGNIKSKGHFYIRNIFLFWRI